MYLLAIDEYGAWAWGYVERDISRTIGSSTGMSTIKETATPTDVNVSTTNSVAAWIHDSNCYHVSSPFVEVFEDKFMISILNLIIF